jgi:hypothetical protein
MVTVPYLARRWLNTCTNWPPNLCSSQFLTSHGGVWEVELQEHVSGDAEGGSWGTAHPLVVTARGGHAHAVHAPRGDGVRNIEFFLAFPFLAANTRGTFHLDSRDPFTNAWDPISPTSRVPRPSKANGARFTYVRRAFPLRLGTRFNNVYDHVSLRFRAMFHKGWGTRFDWVLVLISLINFTS